MIVTKTITYWRGAIGERMQGVLCKINEDPQSGEISIDIRAERIPESLQDRHDLTGAPESHLDEFFPSSAGWTKSIVSVE